MRTTILSLACILCTAMLYATEPQKASVTTQKATVFLNGAQLQQQASLRLQKGQNEVRIEGLSPMADKQSISVSITGGAVVTANEYSIDYISLPQTDARVKALQDSVNMLEAQATKLDNSLQTNKQMQDLLQQGVSSTMQTLEHTLTTEMIEKQLNYYQNRQQQLLTQQNDLNRQNDKIKKRLEELKKQLQQETRQNRQRSGVLNLVVQSNIAGTVTAQVKYYTTSAYWKPYYDLQVSEVGKPVALTLKAYVAQTTGFDWKNVNLTLSTGSPSKSNNLPELQAWRLREQRPVETYRKAAPALARSNAVMREEAVPVMGGADVEVAMDYMEEETYSMAQYVEQKEQSLSEEYAIAVSYTVAGNGKEQTVTLSEQKADADYRYQCVPKLDKTAYLTATIKDWQKLSLLNATANIIAGNTYFGQTEINTASTAEALSIPLGDDPQVMVKRELQSEQSKRKTVGQNKQATQMYRLTVRNNKKQAIKISLKEPYPVSAAKEISVELDEKTTRWTDNDKDSGILTYDIELQAGESKTIMVGYIVKYPKDWQINF